MTLLSIMAYGLIPFQTTQDATRAVNDGQQLLIDGRRVRVELAECRSKYMIDVTSTLTDHLT